MVGSLSDTQITVVRFHYAQLRVCTPIKHSNVPKGRSAKPIAYIVNGSSDSFVVWVRVRNACSNRS